MSSSRGTQSRSSRLQLGLPQSALGASAEYRYRLQAVYQSPYRRDQPCLHPQKENGALWKHRKGVRPPYISNDDWVRLLAEWDTPKAKLRSEKAATSRQTPIDGSTMHVHYGGPNSFSKINYTLSRRHIDAQMTPTVIPSLRELLGRLKKRLLRTKKVNPRYGEAYGVSSAKTQFYQPYIHYPSSTQEVTRSEFDAFKTSTQGRLDRLEAGSSTGSGQIPHDQEDQSQGTLDPTIAPQGGIQLEEFNTTHLNSLGNFDYDM
ncbi:unnamed protein product [Cochlearia groenlandica]